MLVREILPVVKSMAQDARELSKEARLLEGQIQTRKQSIQEWTSQREALKSVLKKAAKVTSLRKGMVRLRKMESTLEEIQDIRHKSRDLSSLIQDQEALLDKADPALTSYEEAASRLRSMQDMAVELRAMQSDLDCVVTNQVMAEKVLESAPRLAEAEKVATRLGEARLKLRALEDVHEDLFRVRASIEALDTDLANAVRRVEKAQLKYAEIRSEIGVCPTCGAEMGDCDE